MLNDKFLAQIIRKNGGTVKSSILTVDLKIKTLDFLTPLDLNRVVFD